MATKIVKSSIRNIKSIDELEAVFNGKTAYVIGGNTKGKTTFIRFLFDRLSKGKTNDNSVLKDKSAEGVSEIIMNDGCGFKYIITPDGKEKLIYITDGIEIKATKEIINKYIGKPFDIDKFIELQPKEKFEYISKIFNVDISEEKKKISELINERRLWSNMIKEKESIIKTIDISDVKEVDINALYKKKEEILQRYEQEKKAIDEKNTLIRQEYDKKYEDLLQKMLQYNKTQQDNKTKRDNLIDAFDILNGYEDTKHIAKQVKDVIDSIIIKPEKTIEELKNYLGEPNLLPYPQQPDLTEIDKEIEEAKKAVVMMEKRKEYERLVNELNSTKAKLDDVNEQIKELEQTIKDKLARINLPESITTDGENIYYNGFPVDKEHLSTSELYIVALMLGSITLKDLKVMHFDCSALDKISMQKVLKYAKDNDLQLLIERPDFEGGDIYFELIEE